MQCAYSANIIYALRICQEKNQDHFADINEMVENQGFRKKILFTKKPGLNNTDMIISKPKRRFD